MNISIFGLGYVGAVSAGCLSRDGHKVIGVDPNTTKVDFINAGTTPVIEKDIGAMIDASVRSGSLRATSDVGDAISHSQISLVCVGTPSQMNGNLDLRYVRKVCEQIGCALKEKNEFHVVVVRSTMLPGSMRDIVIPILELASGKQAGVGFGVCSNPEFLREGSAVFDYYSPPKTVIGETDAQSGDMLLALYEKISAPLIRTDIETAEMVKYTDNAWHAVKVAFANEVGNLCKATGLDGHRVMDIFCQDTKLNLSSCYLKPGFAFGGSCLPKDIRALVYKAKTLDVTLPLMNSILASNGQQIENGIKMIIGAGNKKVGILGFSFKAGTDDLRESPLVEVIEHLIGKGYDLKLYDRNVNLASLMGANQDYILNRIPHIAKLMVPAMDQILELCDTIVVGNGAEEFRNIMPLLRQHQTLIDFVRINSATSSANYNGICW